MPRKGSKFPVRPCRWCGVVVTHCMDGFHPRDHWCGHSHEDPRYGTVRHKCWEGKWFGLPFSSPPGSMKPFLSGNAFGQTGPVVQHGCDQCLAAYIARTALEVREVIW